MKKLIALMMVLLCAVGAQALAQEVLLFLGENAKDAFIRNFATDASRSEARE